MDKLGKRIIIRARSGRQKSLIEIKPMTDFNDKEWVCITFLNGRSNFISLEEIYYLVKWIGECEQRKYPKTWQKGKEMVCDFLADTIWSDSSFEELFRKYKFKKEET